MTTQTYLTPRIIGRAENAHRPILDRLLAANNMSMTAWVALVLTAEAPEGLDCDQLADRLVATLKVDAATATEARAELMAAQLLVAAAGAASHVVVTPAGLALHARVRAAVDRTITRVYRDIPAEELQTTARVLTLIANRLDAEATSPQP